MWFAPGSPTRPGKGFAPLNPFHQDTAGTPWTSNACRNWRTSLKYDYDDFTVPGPPADSAAAPPVTPPAVLSLATDSTSASPPDVLRDLSALKRRINEKYGIARRELNRSPGIDGHKNDYVINIIYDR
jgi:hypothetical protein